MLLTACGGVDAADVAIDAADAAQEQASKEGGEAAFCERLDALDSHDPADEVRIGSPEHLDRLAEAVEGVPEDVQQSMQRLIDYLAGLDLADAAVEDVPAAVDYPAEVGEGIIAVQDYRAEVCPDWPPDPGDHEH